MTKKVLGLLLAAVIIVSFAVGCGNNNAGNTEGEITPDATAAPASGDSGNQVTITFWEHVADIKTNAPHVYNIVQAFNEQNPDIHVELSGAASDEHTMRIKLAAQTNSLPDIFYMISGDAKDMANSGYLADISKDILADQDFANRFLPGMLDSMKIGDAIYGIPAEMFVNGIWYNKDLFDKCGLELPVTFDDLLNCAKVFNENGIVPMARGTKDVWSCWSIWTMHCRYGFYDHIDGIINGTDKWNNPDYLRFYTMIKRMTDANMFPKNMSTMGYDQALQMFISGQAAMFDSGAWDIPQFEGCKYADSIGFWWGPTFSDGVGNQEVSMKAPSHPYCVSAKTKEESPEKYAACIKFLKFFYGPEGTQIIVDANCIPVTHYNGKIDSAAKPVYAKVMERINDDWESPLVCPNVYLGTFETTYFESIAGVMNGIYTPEEAVDYLDEQSVAQGLVKK